jgi:hypothetical protein
MRDAFEINTSAAERLAEMLEPYIGRRLLGVVDGVGCTEIVFSGDDGNLLSLWLRDAGVRYANGFVADPDSYADRCRTRPRRAA